MDIQDPLRMMLECEKDVENRCIINLPVPEQGTADMDELKDVHVVPVLSTVDLTMFLKTAEANGTLKFNERLKRDPEAVVGVKCFIRGVNKYGSGDWSQKPFVAEIKLKHIDDSVMNLSEVFKKKDAAEKEVQRLLGELKKAQEKMDKMSVEIAYCRQKSVE